MTTALAKITALDVVRQVFGADTPWENAGYLLWNHSAYPLGPSLEAYRESLLVSKLTWENGQQPCNGCGGLAVAGIGVCDDCNTPEPASPQEPQAFYMVPEDTYNAMMQRLEALQVAIRDMRDQMGTVRIDKMPTR